MKYTIRVGRDAGRRQSQYGTQCGIYAFAWQIMYEAAADLCLRHIERVCIRRTFRHSNLLLERLNGKRNNEAHSLSGMNEKLLVIRLETISLNNKFIRARRNRAETKLSACIRPGIQSIWRPVQFRRDAGNSRSALVLHDS